MSTKQPLPIQNRRKELNVIYFIDSSRTRTFTVSLTAVKLFCVSGLVVFVWSLLSIGILFYMLSIQNSSNNRLSHLLTTIFDYQARYDGVYEAAYPSGNQPAVPQQQETPVLTAGAESRDANTLAAKNLLPLGGTESTKKQDLTAKSEKAAKAAGSDIEIDEPIFTEMQQSLVVDFAIKNSTPDTRSSGFVWAVGRLRTTQGQDIYVGQPSAIEVDSTGTVRKQEKATSFTIRRFKPVSVQFDRPGGVAGAFQDVKIFVMDEKGQKQEYKFPVEFKTNSAALDMRAKNGATVDQNIKSDALDSEAMPTESNNEIELQGN